MNGGATRKVVAVFLAVACLSLRPASADAQELWFSPPDASAGGERCTVPDFADLLPAMQPGECRGWRPPVPVEQLLLPTNAPRTSSAASPASYTTTGFRQP